jgi:NADH-quinone oxidoreductase subunit J
VALMVNLLVFTVATLLVLGGAIGVVTSRNPVYSALLLVVTLLGVALFFVMQQAHLVAAVQVIVYASAIVVLFLFVIMLLGVDREESLEDPIKFQRPVAFVLGGVVLAEILFLGGRHWATGAHSSAGPLHGGSRNVETVARSLFTQYLWPFELTAALLVIAVVGGVVLARRSGQRVGDVAQRSQNEVKS